MSESTALRVSVLTSFNLGFFTDIGDIGPPPRSDMRTSGDALRADCATSDPLLFFDRVLKFLVAFFRVPIVLFCILIGGRPVLIVERTLVTSTFLLTTGLNERMAYGYRFSTGLTRWNFSMSSDEEDDFSELSSSSSLE